MKGITKNMFGIEIRKQGEKIQKTT